MASRVLSLTQDHIAQVHRAIADTGPVPGVPQHDDFDYAEWVERTLARIQLQTSQRGSSPMDR